MTSLNLLLQDMSRLEVLLSRFETKCRPYYVSKISNSGCKILIPFRS